MNPQEQPTPPTIPEPTMDPLTPPEPIGPAVAPTPSPSSMPIASPPVDSSGSNSALPAMHEDPSQLNKPHNKMPFIIGAVAVIVGLMIVIALLIV